MYIDSGTEKYIEKGGGRRGGGEVSEFSSGLDWRFLFYFCILKIAKLNRIALFSPIFVLVFCEVLGFLSLFKKD